MANRREYEADFWEYELPRRRAKRRRRSPLGPVLLALILFGAFVALGYYFASAWLEGSFPSIPGGGVGPLKKNMNILLLGIDQRKNEPARSDAVIAAFVDPDSPRVKLLSIPRDTYVVIPGRGGDKIAHANAYGGPELAMETAERLLGVPVRKYVEVNFEGFERVIDILGGVEIDVEKRMYYPEEGINLRPGRQRLYGHDALAYVRYRSDALGDIGRVQRQQKFLAALLDQAVRAGTLLKLPELIPELAANVRTNLTPKEMLSLARTFSRVDMAAVEASTLPGEPAYINGVSYFIPESQKTREIVTKFIARN